MNSNEIEKRLIGFSGETRMLIRKMIAVNSAMDEAILELADLAFADGIAEAGW